ncbi:unnamed protein product, partial [Closterium sp. NIES-53]
MTCRMEPSPPPMPAADPLAVNSGGIDEDSGSNAPLSAASQQLLLDTLSRLHADDSAQPSAAAAEGDDVEDDDWAEEDGDVEEEVLDALDWLDLREDLASRGNTGGGAFGGGFSAARRPNAFGGQLNQAHANARAAAFGGAGKGSGGGAGVGGAAGAMQPRVNKQQRLTARVNAAPMRNPFHPSKHPPVTCLQPPVLTSSPLTMLPTPCPAPRISLSTSSHTIRLVKPLLPFMIYPQQPTFPLPFRAPLPPHHLPLPPLRPPAGAGSAHAHGALQDAQPRGLLADQRLPLHRQGGKINGCKEVSHHHHPHHHHHHHPHHHHHHHPHHHHHHSSPTLPAPLPLPSVTPRPIPQPCSPMNRLALLSANVPLHCYHATPHAPSPPSPPWLLSPLAPLPPGSSPPWLLSPLAPLPPGTSPPWLLSPLAPLPPGSSPHPPGERGAGVQEGGEVQAVKELAVKVYKTSILVFKDRERYVAGDYRFRHGYSKHNPRKMVKVWAEKEFRNLNRLRAAGVTCPVPLMLRMHVLVMSFIGTEGWGAPRLKDVQLSEGRWRECYGQVVEAMWRMYRLCRLVHGDLSEYNLLYLQ